MDHPMSALPMTLETALRHQGFIIEPLEVASFAVEVTDVGSIVIPAMVTSKLTWGRDGSPELGDDLYLSSLPLFNESYRPVLLSSILDRFRTRRLGYNTPGEWRLAFRRWGNLNMTIPNQRYVSTAVPLPLDNRSETDATEATEHGLDIESDFPQSIVSGSTDYSSTATDRRQADNETVLHTGRSTSIMELLAQQRATYLNVDAEVIEGLESLFLGVFDAGESDRSTPYDPPRAGYPFGRYFDWNW
jgi:hypothetical protein